MNSIAFSKAAQRLGMSPPRLDRLIRRGLPLLSTPGVVAGAYQHRRVLLADLERLEAALLFGDVSIINKNVFVSPEFHAEDDE